MNSPTCLPLYSPDAEWGLTINCMWPKAFAQFVELAPHISRLLPLADRFLQSKTATEDTGRRALETASAGLQAELGQISASQGVLLKQIGTLAEGVAGASSEIRTARLALEALEASTALVTTQAVASDRRISAMEEQLGRVDTQLQRMTERARLAPVIPLLVLTNLILLAALIAVLLHAR